jgi:tRNA(fMet)-specific endonuclease VapC
VLNAIADGDTFAINVPILAETLFGIRIMPRGVQNYEAWLQLQPQFQCHVPTAQDAERAAELQLNLRKQGRQLATVDALVAITALHYDLTLLTTDKDFDAVPGLRHENWR